MDSKSLSYGPENAYPGGFQKYVDRNREAYSGSSSRLIIMQAY